jgi:hypothetical protein
VTWADLVRRRCFPTGTAAHYHWRRARKRLMHHRAGFRVHARVDAAVWRDDHTKFACRCEIMMLRYDDEISRR